LSKDNENKEDILTSNVFSFFKYANREIFLFEFIRLLGLEISTDDAISAEFRFWPTFEDKTEPDLVLIIGKYYLLFEAKYHSGFGEETREKEHQIVREIIGGRYEAKNLGKEFKIVAVTAYYSDKPELKRGVPEKYLKGMLWINWQSIALLVYQQVENNPKLPIGTRLFAKDLYDLLVRKKLRNFEGVKVFSILPKALHSMGDRIFFDARSASYRGAFLGFTTTLADLSLQPLSSKVLFLNPRKDFFLNLGPVGKPIHPIENIFFERSTNE
jgi:hypothetical protein